MHSFASAAHWCIALPPQYAALQSHHPARRCKTLPPQFNTKRRSAPCPTKQRTAPGFTLPHHAMLCPCLTTQHTATAKPYQTLHCLAKASPRFTVPNYCFAFAIHHIASPSPYKTKRNKTLPSP